MLGFPLRVSTPVLFHAGGLSAGPWELKVLRPMRTVIAVILAWVLAAASLGALCFSWSRLQQAREERTQLRVEADRVANLTGQIRQQEADLTHDEGLAAEAKEADFLHAEVAQVARQAAAAEQRNQIQEAIAAARKAVASANQALHRDESKPQVAIVPRPISQGRPKYPYAMHYAGVSGIVTVDFIVAADGRVRNAFAYSSTRPEFEAAAIEAVSRWQFKAGMRDGVPVNFHMQVPIVFSVTGENGPVDSKDWLPMNDHAS